MAQGIRYVTKYLKDNYRDGKLNNNCSWGLVYNKLPPSFRLSKACHAGLLKRDHYDEREGYNDKPKKVALLTYSHDDQSYNVATKDFDIGQRWTDWLYYKSPYAQFYKCPKSMSANGGDVVVLDASLPHNQLLAAATASRHIQEHGDIVRRWDTFTLAGVDPRLSLLLAYGSRKSEKVGTYFLTIRLKRNGHTLFPRDMSREYLNNYLSGEVDAGRCRVSSLWGDDEGVGFLRELREVLIVGKTKTKSGWGVASMNDTFTIDTLSERADRINKEFL